jgi:hypothetical protein
MAAYYCSKVPSSYRALCTSSFPNLDNAINDTIDDVRTTIENVFVRILLHVTLPTILAAAIVLFVAAAYDVVSGVAALIAFLLFLFVLVATFVALYMWLVNYASLEEMVLLADLANFNRAPM